MVFDDADVFEEFTTSLDAVIAREYGSDVISTWVEEVGDGGGILRSACGIQL